MQEMYVDNIRQGSKDVKLNKANLGSYLVTCPKRSK